MLLLLFYFLIRTSYVIVSLSRILNFNVKCVDLDQMLWSALFV